jgi:TonB-linked SusC/RagA family outer membrane protein
MLYSILILQLFCFTAFAQQNVSGSIKAANGDPIPGAGVSVKGTTNTTQSDAAGNFAISVSAGAVLAISHVGYLGQDIKVGKQNFLSIVLTENAQLLSDVVVVGYGRQKRATVTGSVSEIKGSEILKSPAPNIANNLAGRVPGIISTNESGEPGEDGARLLIRGVNTFSGATSPLIVVDGVANRLGGFERLNPNDIESVTVLKDASAAIYGAQAANGVILVTTKRGKSGKAQINFNYNQALNNWIKVPKLTNAAQYAELANETKIYAGQTPIYSAEDIQKFREGSNPLTHPNTNWIDEVVRDVTPQSRANISVSGGSDKTTYYASYGRIAQEGQFKNSNIFSYTQDNLALNLDAQVVNNLKVSFDMQLRHQDRIGPAGSSSSTFRDYGWGSDGSYNLFTGLFASLPLYPARFPDGRLGVTSGASNSFLNPIAMVSGLGGEARFRDLYTLNTFRYRLDIPQITKGLFLDGFVSADLQASSSKDFRKSWSVFKYDPTTQTYSEQRQTLSAAGLASLGQNYNSSKLITFNSKLNFTRVFAEAHSVNAFIAFEQQQFKSEFFSAQRNNFFTDNISELDFGSPNNATNNGNASNTARRNYFARVNYGFKDKYLFEAQARYDGSDKFPSDRRWGLFPSISAGWRLSSEPWAQGFMKGNDLKIRASWGKLGNDAIDPYQFLQFYRLNAAGFVLNGALAPTLSPDVLPNPFFTWESAESINLAIDGSLLKNRLTYVFEAFQQKRSDVLTRRNATVPIYTGLVLPVENIGKVRNRGLEGQLKFNSTAGKVSYNVAANITYTRNKVLFFDESPSIPEYQKLTGRPINSGLFYVDKGLFQSQREIDNYPTYTTGQIPRPGDVKFADTNGDSTINFLDQVRLDQNNTPEIVYGLITGLDWKGLDISVLFQGQARSKVFFYPHTSSVVNSYHFLFEGRSTPDRVTDKPSTAGDFFSRPQYNPNTLPFFRRNTSFVRLKNVEIGYKLSSRMLENLKMSNVRFYLNASNLLTFAKFKDVDPESLNRLNGRGYPILRTVNFGVNVGF